MEHCVSVCTEYIFYGTSCVRVYGVAYISLWDILCPYVRSRLYIFMKYRVYGVGYISLWNIVYPGCVKTRCSKNTKAWTVSHQSDTSQNIKVWAVSHPSDTSKKPKAGAVSQHADTSKNTKAWACLLYTSPSPRDMYKSRMPSSA